MRLQCGFHPGGQNHISKTPLFKKKIFQLWHYKEALRIRSLRPNGLRKRTPPHYF